MPDAGAQLCEAKRLSRNRVGGTSPLTPPPSDEVDRLTTLSGYAGALGGKNVDSLNRLARLTVQLLNMPRPFVSLVGDEGAVLIGRHNVDLERVSRDAAHCAHPMALAVGPMPRAGSI